MLMPTNSFGRPSEPNWTDIAYVMISAEVDKGRKEGRMSLKRNQGDKRGLTIRLIFGTPESHI
jgi:hypothetical protein